MTLFGQKDFLSWMTDAATVARGLREHSERYVAQAVEHEVAAEEHLKIANGLRKEATLAEQAARKIGEAAKVIA